MRFVLPIEESPKYDDFFDANVKDKNAMKGNQRFIMDCIGNVEDCQSYLGQKASAYKLSGAKVFVKPELLCDLGCETPRINYENYLGKEYRYFYAISSDVDLDNPGTVI